MKWLLASLFALVALAPAQPEAGEADAQAVRDYCLAEVAPTGQVCDCLLRQFAKLTDGQQALVAAIVAEDAAALAAAGAGLTAAERGAAESFLQRETMLCRPSG